MSDLATGRARLWATSRPLRVAAAVVATLVAIPIAVTVLDRAVTGPNEVHGPDSSSYSTDDTGLSAFAELLSRYDHRVTRVQGGNSFATTPRGATLVVLDAPDLTNAQATALGRWVHDGGALVTGGVDPVYLVRFLDRTPTWLPFAPIDWRVRGVGSAREVRSGGFGSFETSSFGPEATLLATNDDGVLAARLPLGSGTVTVLSDSSPLSNARVAQRDNAAFGLGLVTTNQVVFAENVDVEQPGSTGLDALPARWRFAALGCLVAALVFMWARGRRFGPPEQRVRALHPPRAEHLDAVATMLEQSGDSAGAIAPVQTAVQRSVAARSLLGPVGTVGTVGPVGTTGDGHVEPQDLATFAAAAAHLGIPADEATAACTPPLSDTDMLAAGRALARVRNWE